MISELSVIWISLSVIVLCWAVVRINQKIDEAIRNYKPHNSIEISSPPPRVHDGARQRAPFPPQ
jgi:hypothetical protein